MAPLHHDRLTPAQVAAALRPGDFAYCAVPPDDYGECDHCGRDPRPLWADPDEVDFAYCAVCWLDMIRTDRADTGQGHVITPAGLEYLRRIEADAPLALAAGGR